MNIKVTALAVMAAAAVIGGTLLVLAPYAGAQEPETTPPVERGARRAALLERVAAHLGVEVTELQQAITDAQLEMVDEALANGRITEEQADTARERINNGEGLRGPRERHRQHDRRAKIRAGIIEESAAAIGITPAELRESLRAGHSIADAAEANGVPLDDVKAAIIDAAKTKLDAAVANSRIDQTRADELLAMLESRLDDLLNRTREPTATQ